MGRTGPSRRGGQLRPARVTRLAAAGPWRGEPGNQPCLCRSRAAFACIPVVPRRAGGGARSGRGISRQAGWIRSSRRRHGKSEEAGALPRCSWAATSFILTSSEKASLVAATAWRNSQRARARVVPPRNRSDERQPGDEHGAIAILPRCGEIEPRSTPAAAPSEESLGCITRRSPRTATTRSTSLLPRLSRPIACTRNTRTH